MAEVQYIHASRIYPGNPVPAVNDLNLDIEDGEFMVLVGPSGSGKSTALRMLAGLEDVDEGEVHIDGKDVSTKPPKDRDIAMVFQNYALYPHMSVAENMGFALKLKGVPKAERAAKVREAAKMLDLEQYLDRKPKALSGGQRQRVAMGRAIVREPSVFLMDEPLSNLDAKLRVETRANIAAHLNRIILGVRPESFHVASDASDLALHVNLVEELGADAFVHGTLPGEDELNTQQFVVRFDGRVPPRVGETITFQIRTGEEHAFNPETGERLR